MRKVIATGIAAMFFATAAVPAHAMDPILPFQDVKGGMTGTAYTVVDSSGEIAASMWISWAIWTMAKDRPA